MKVTVDLNKCQDHGQCVYAAPEIFALDDDGKLSLRHEATDEYVSGELDESMRDALEEAADVCPMLAIDLID